jgi:(p)ppGpp synthase/HD superfamily hydrolase
MHQFAQTNIQLLSQLTTMGYSEAEIEIVRRAYRLSMRLFTGFFRGNGKTFIAHLVGTASILASEHSPGVVVAAGLAHAAYMEGNFGDERRGLSANKRNQVRQTIGDEAESYIARYTTMTWNSKAIAFLAEHVEELSDIDRTVILMRLANELEDHLDGGILYCANIDRRLHDLEQNSVNLVKMAKALGYDHLAAKLDQVFVVNLSAQRLKPIPKAQNYSFLLPPQSYQQRLSVRLRILLAKYFHGLRSCIRQHC